MPPAREVPVPPLRPEGTIALPLPRAAPLRRAVFVRLHAFGDTAIALPVTAGFAARFPGCRVEVVTGPASADLFRARSEVHAVHVLDARAPRPADHLAALRLGRALRAEPLDLLVDLQRSSLTRTLRFAARAPAWALFDRFAPRHALDRYVDALDACGLGRVPPLFAPLAREAVAARARELLAAAGRDAERPLVCLNPAGGWPTKQWPLDRWAALGRALAAGGAQVLLLGAAESRVAALARELGPEALDLTGRTTPGEAMAAVAECARCISEDSGLMHLAWAQGVPTLALFGASRSVWSRPAGPRSDGFFSDDLPCGACMRPECARGDVHCLDRVSVEAVWERAGST